MNTEERRFESFLSFLRVFVSELNLKCEGNTALLVEGKRDVIALRKIGFTGNVITLTSFVKMRQKGSLMFSKLIVMTDFDKEGRYLASRLCRTMPRVGIDVSVEERKKLLDASKGLLYNIENLSRFADFLSL